MKRVALIAATFLALAGSALAQVQHATSIDQCRADWRLWNSQDSQKGGFDALTSIQIMSRASEMHDCVVIDPSNQGHYWNMSDEFIIEVGMRREHFITRHNSMQQFLDEDAAGQR